MVSSLLECQALICWGSGRVKQLCFSLSKILLWVGGLGPQESMPTERKKPQVRMILNSALMSHNAGAISHQNPCGSEAEEKDKTKGRCLFVLIFMGGGGGGCRRYEACQRAWGEWSVLYWGSFHTLYVCVWGCWVAWTVGPDGEPRRGSSAVEEPCGGQAELAGFRGRLMFSSCLIGTRLSFCCALIHLATTSHLRNNKKCTSTNLTANHKWQYSTQAAHTEF